MKSFSKNYLALIVLFLFSCQSPEIEQAKRFIDASMFEEAIPLLKLELINSPKNGEASFLYAKCMFEIKSEKDSIDKYFKQAALLDSDYSMQIVKIYYKDGIEHLKVKIQGDEDTQNFNRDRKLDNLAKSFKQAEDFGILDELKKLYAADLYDFSLELSKVDDRSYRILEIFKSINVLDSSYAPQLAENLYDLSKSFFEKGFIDDAFNYADACIKYDGKQAEDVKDLYYSYGEDVLMNNGDPFKSLEIFEKVLSIDKKAGEDISDLYKKSTDQYIESKNFKSAAFTAIKALDLDRSKEKWYNEVIEKISSLDNTKYKFDESIAYTGKIEKYFYYGSDYVWVLTLLIPSEFEGASSGYKFKNMQIVGQRVNQYENKYVVITGEASEAHTLHHRADLILIPNSIKLLF